MECYQEVYKELGVDFDTVSAEPDFFMDYEMSTERQEAILEEVIKKYKLKPYYRKAVRINYWLGCSPKSIAE